MFPLPRFGFLKSKHTEEVTQGITKKRHHLSCLTAETIPSINELKIYDGCDDSLCKQKEKVRPVGGSFLKGKDFKSSSSHAYGRDLIQFHVTRKNFCTLKNVRPDESFTNHECIPSFDESYTNFIRVYPEYMQTGEIDKVRVTEYAYLNENGHVFLDYCGYGLLAEGLGVSYISANLPTHALYGGADKGTVEYDIKQRIYQFLNLQESEYSMVFTSSRESAFKLLAESYPFHVKKKLLTVYDHECEAVSRMEETAKKNGAEITNSAFRWPSQTLCSTDLRKKMQNKKNKNKTKNKNKKETEEQEEGEHEGGFVHGLLKKKMKKRQKKRNDEGEEEEQEELGFVQGLLVFPVQSRVTGAKYSYQWMHQAQENGWEVLLDASALMPKALGALGLSVFRPDFIVTSFFKVYGLDPTGFGCLFIKRCAIQRLLSTSAARGVGMVRLIPIPVVSEGDPEDRGDEGSHVMSLDRSCPSSRVQDSIDGDDDDDDDDDSLCEMNEHYASSVCDVGIVRGSYSQAREVGSFRASCNQISDCLNPSFLGSDASLKAFNTDDVESSSSSRFDASNHNDASYARKEPEVKCKGLDHAEILGYSKTNIRYRCLINWLIGSMLKLQHPGLPAPNPLIQIYGPKLNFDRGPSIAFNLFDWRGSLLQPLLVQRLADRSNISIGVSTLHHLKPSLELREKLNEGGSFSLSEVSCCDSDNKWRGFRVVTVALGFLSNFEDVYKFWAFLAKFLDADFVSKEVWRYRSLNQETVVFGGQ